MTEIQTIKYCIECPYEALNICHITGYSCTFCDSVFSHKKGQKREYESLCEMYSECPLAGTMLLVGNVRYWPERKE